MVNKSEIELLTFTASLQHSHYSSCSGHKCGSQSLHFIWYPISNLSGNSVSSNFRIYPWSKHFPALPLICPWSPCSITSLLEFGVSFLIGRPTPSTVPLIYSLYTYQSHPFKICQNISFLCSRPSEGFSYYSWKSKTFTIGAFNYSGSLLALWPHLLYSPALSLPELYAYEALCCSLNTSSMHHHEGFGTDCSLHHNALFQIITGRTLTSFSSLLIWCFPIEVFSQHPKITTPSALSVILSPALFSTFALVAKWHTIVVYYITPPTGI